MSKDLFCHSYEYNTDETKVIDFDDLTSDSLYCVEDYCSSDPDCDVDFIILDAFGFFTSLLWLSVTIISMILLTKLFKREVNVGAGMRGAANHGGDSRATTHEIKEDDIEADAANNDSQNHTGTIAESLENVVLLEDSGDEEKRQVEPDIKVANAISVVDPSGTSTFRSVIEEEHQVEPGIVVANAVPVVAPNCASTTRVVNERDGSKVGEKTVVDPDSYTGITVTNQGLEQLSG